MSTKVIMPQLGESVVEGTVAKWLRQVGETIQELEPLLEVNTDKVDTEIPSPASGTLLKITVPEGTTVQAGTVLAWIGQPGETPAGEAQIKPIDAAKQLPPVEKKPAGNGQMAGQARSLGFISPVVAKLAAENHLDLNKVKGTGEGGRITKRDVLAYLDQQSGKPAATRAEPAGQAVPAQEIWETPADGDLFRPSELFSSAAPVAPPHQTTPAPASPVSPGRPMPGVKQEPSETDTLIPLTTLRKAIAEHMVLSKHTSPHVTTVMEANLAKVVAHYQANQAVFEKDGARLTYTAYFIAAIIAALKAFPQVNSSWTEQGILVHHQINVGLAVALEDEGLIVPVIKGADGLSLLGLARSINDLGTRARAHRLQPAEVQNGTFTLTNHGVSGSLFATPVINQPQCAILGAGAIQKRVVVIDDAIAIRPMMYLTLTFDHRILDGAIADHFLARVVETLETWH